MSDPTISAQAKGLYGLLTCYANDEGECWPSAAFLGEALGYQRAQVFRLLAELADGGVIEREPQFRDGRQTTTLTRLVDASTATRVSSVIPRGVENDTPGGLMDDTQNKTSRNSKSPTASEADGETPNDADDPLPLDGLPDRKAKTTEVNGRSAQTLVARWVDGNRQANGGGDPHQALLRRVAGQCRNLAKTCSTDADWAKATQAAYDAGRSGAVDPVPFLTNRTSRFQTEAQRNYDPRFD